MIDMPPPPVELVVPIASIPARPFFIVSYLPGPVECDRQPVSGGELARPYAAVATLYGSSRTTVPDSYVLSFSIDADGRTGNIRRDPAVSSASAGASVDTTDLAPALAVSRFSPGTPRRECRVTYRIAITAPAETPKPALYEAFTQASEDQKRYLHQNVLPVGSNCSRGPGGFRQLNRPDFEAIPQGPGTWSWTFLAYDVDAQGRSTNVRVLGSSGNAKLDRAGVTAQKSNSFQKGSGRTGCVSYFYRRKPAESYVPALPNDPMEGRNDPICRIDPKTAARVADPQAFPRPFARRQIEGAAALSYDVAPWGEIGNVKVIASEPAETFGQVARMRLSGGKVAESDMGHRGCYLRVRFKLPPPEEGSEPPPPPPPVF